MVRFSLKKLKDRAGLLREYWSLLFSQPSTLSCPKS